MTKLNKLIRDIRLAIPKDDLFCVAVNTLRSNGIRLYNPITKKQLSGNEKDRYKLPLVAYSDSNFNSIPILTAPDIAQYVLDGTLDIGVTGFDICMEISKINLEGLVNSDRGNVAIEEGMLEDKDWIEKYKKNYGELMYKYLSKAGFIPIMNLNDPISFLVMAFKRESNVRTVTDLQSISNPSIATEFPHVLSEYLKSYNLQEVVKTVLTYGSTEAFVKGNLTTGCLDITTTGRTLRGYNLVPTEIVLASTPWLIANPQCDYSKIKESFLS